MLGHASIVQTIETYTCPPEDIGGDAVGGLALEKEARSTLGEDVECAVTKYALDRWTARCVTLERSREAIKSQASLALSRLDGFAPHKLEEPVTLEVEFTSTSEALWAPLMPGTQRKSPRTVSYTADNIVDTWKGFLPRSYSAGRFPTRCTDNQREA